MSKDFFTNAFRFAFLCLVQILVLQRISLSLSSFPYINIMIYPLFIFLLPFSITPTILTLLGFFLGITIDIAYDSLGIHASVTLAIAFFRPYLIKWMEPKGGYTSNSSPTVKRMGWGWFLRYAAILIGMHHFLYFSVQAFTFVYIISILLKTIIAFLLSMLFIIFTMAIFNPSD